MNEKKTEHASLEAAPKAVLIKVFIHAPFHELVRENTRFWNASGLDVAMDAGGIRINTESLLSVMSGGIAFETPANLEPGGAAKEGQEFFLYETKEATRTETYTKKTRWLLHFSGSVRGLTIGAPVEFRGIKIGQVLDVRLQLNMKAREFRIPVLVEIEPGRLEAEDMGVSESERRELMDRLVERGLRAQLKTGSFVTGQLYVDMDITDFFCSGFFPECQSYVSESVQRDGRRKTMVLRLGGPVWTV